MLYYSYNDFVSDTKKLVSHARDFAPDVILPIARGGLTLAQFMAEALEHRYIYSINTISYQKDSSGVETAKGDVNIFNVPDLGEAKKVLVVDDIIDSGDTIHEVMKLLQAKYPHIEFKTAVIFYKNTAIFRADYSVREATAWIDFFWEKDMRDA